MSEEDDFSALMCGLDVSTDDEDAVGGFESVVEGADVSAGDMDTCIRVLTEIRSAKQFPQNLRSRELRDSLKAVRPIIDTYSYHIYIT